MSFPPLKQEEKQETNPIDVQTNPYLEKERQKFQAKQWLEQLRVQIVCGYQKSITIDKTTYLNRTISDDQEKEIQNANLLMDKLEQLTQIKFQQLGIESDGTVKEIDIAKIKEQIADIQKEAYTAERDFFKLACKHFYSIPDNVAMANKELLSPYISGRIYLKDLRVVGNTWNAIQNDTMTPQMLRKFVNYVTERQYS